MDQNLIISGYLIFKALKMQIPKRGVFFGTPCIKTLMFRERKKIEVKSFEIDQNSLGYLKKEINNFRQP